MSLSLKAINAVNLFVENIVAAKTFYDEVLGLTLTFESETAAVFVMDNLMLCLNDIVAAPELIGPAQVARVDAGSRVMLAVFVDDVDATCVELTHRGVELINGPIDRPWGVRTATFADPSGHIWEILHRLDSH